jgi:competence protein ComEC
MCAGLPVVRVGEARISVLSPRGTPAPGGDVPDVNESSLVLRVEEGPVTALFTGDIGADTEALLLHNPEALRARVLKVPHHGSRYSALPEFFRAVSPEIALIGAGYRNGFGLPAREALEALSRTACEICRTDRDGTITVQHSPGGEKLVISSVNRHFN